MKIEDIKLGATGGFPQGKLSEDDEGALNIAVGIEKGKVAIRFGTPVAWFAMDEATAMDLANGLLSKCRDLRIMRAAAGP